MELTLNQSLNLAKKIKEQDYNDEFDIIVDTIDGRPKLIIQSKLIEIGGYNGRTN